MIFSMKCCVCKEEQKIIGIFFLQSCSRLWVCVWILISDSLNSQSPVTSATSHLLILSKLGPALAYCWKWACLKHGVPASLNVFWRTSKDEWVSACHTTDNVSETKKMKIVEKFSEAAEGVRHWKQSTFNSPTICLKKTCLTWGSQNT